MLRALGVSEDFFKRVDRSGSGSGNDGRSSSDETGPSRQSQTNHGDQRPSLTDQSWMEDVRRAQAREGYVAPDVLEELREPQRRNNVSDQRPSISDEVSWMEDVRRVHAQAGISSDILNALRVPENSIRSAGGARARRRMTQSSVAQDMHGPIPLTDILEGSSDFGSSGGSGSISGSGHDRRSPVPSSFSPTPFHRSNEPKSGRCTSPPSPPLTSLDANQQADPIPCTKPSLGFRKRRHRIYPQQHLPHKSISDEGVAKDDSLRNENEEIQIAAMYKRVEVMRLMNQGRMWAEKIAKDHRLHTEK